jgi:hypothetical protein
MRRPGSRNEYEILKNAGAAVQEGATRQDKANRLGNVCKIWSFDGAHAFLKLDCPPTCDTCIGVVLFLII